MASFLFQHTPDKFKIAVEFIHLATVCLLFTLRVNTEMLLCQLRVIHTCDLLGVNYCMNFTVHAIMKTWLHSSLLNFSVHTKS